VDPEFQTASVDRSPDDFRRSVLQIVAEFSPCSEEKLFIVAVNRDLRASRSLSLGDLKGLLHDCIQQLEEQGLLRIVAEEIVITEAGTRPPEAQTPNGTSPEPTPEKIVGYIREAIKQHQTVLAKEQTKSGQAEAEKGSGEDIIGDIESLSNGGDAASATDEEILDLTAELGGLEIVEDDAEPVTELTDGDIAAPSNGDDAAPSANDEEIYDLTAELGGLEIVEDDHRPVMGLAKADEPLDLGEPEPVDFERVVALYQAEQATISTTPQPKAHRLETAPKRAEPRTRATLTVGDRGGSAPTAEPMAGAEGSGQVFSGAAEMMRDIVMVLLLLAFAATSLLSWFNGKPTAVLMMLALLLLGSAFWGWRGSRLRRQ